MEKRANWEAGSIAETTVNKGCGELRGGNSGQSHPQILRTGQKYYGPSNIEAFWGTSEDFLAQLWPKVNALLERPIVVNGY